MNVRIPFVDDINYPVRLGPDSKYAILRGPSISYALWGIEGPEETLTPLSRKQYAAEWERGGPEQMHMVRDAAKAALGDCPGMLYATDQRIMLSLVKYWLDLTKKVMITEPGFGKSTVSMYKYLLENDIKPDSIFLTGIEPSQKRIDSATAELKDMGLKEGKHFIALAGTDLEKLPLVKGQHIIKEVATKHHDSYPITGFQYCKESLVPGGFIADLDWFERMCMYPSLVLRFYQSLDPKEFGWDTKEEDLENFKKAFPNVEYVPDLNPAAWMGVNMIDAFWKGVAREKRKRIEKGIFDSNDEIFLQEAHGHPEWYATEMLRAGFRLYSKEIDDIVKDAKLNGNPHRITTKKAMLDAGMDKFFDYIPKEGSELLTAIIGQNNI